jgi:hypothetical protein
MNWQLPPKRRFPTRFRPHLERLETRDCPSCTVVQRGETLFILGDREANHIAIADTRDGGISVTLEVGDPHRFTGVKRIDLRTFGGNDEITATCPSDANFQFRADLGAGNDKLSISGFDPQPDPPLWRVAFDIFAGTGDDEITATVTCPSDPSFKFRADLGAGNDSLLARVGFDPQPDPPSFRGTMDLSARGGAGDDRLSVVIGDAADTRVPAELHGTLRVDLDGGAGDDRAALDVANVDIHGAVLANFHGGSGADQFLMRVAADVRVFGSLDVRALGGAGNDVFESFMIPCVLPAGRASYMFDGEAGNDRIVVDLHQDEEQNKSMDVRVIGGLGDDDLTLAVHDHSDGSRLTALVDGGRGHDVAHITRNVRVANCEEVFSLDDPR